jgi:chemotaxis family two-component system sensor histidine kinase/response regulator PixL
MALNSEIRDQAYQFFIQEAPELLQVIESGLLTLAQDKSTANVHNLMRAAHSLKGGAASVELEAIATVAHRLENIFKALYSDNLEIDTDLESQLLQAYDCLRLPLMQQFVTGGFDAESALEQADPIFAQLEERFADALSQAESYIPSSAELGVDMTRSILEVDVAQGLQRLGAVVANPHQYEVAGELRAQAEVFAGFAELLSLPEFGAIAQTTLAALDAHPERALEITQLALTDFEVARQAVLVGNTPSDRVSEDANLTHPQAIGPSAALVALVSSTPTHEPNFPASFVDESIADPELILVEKEDTIPSIEDIFSSTFITSETDLDDSLTAAEVPQDTQTFEQQPELEEIDSISPESLDELPAIGELPEDIQLSEEEWLLEEIFSISHEFLDELPTTAQVPEDTQLPKEKRLLDEIFSISPEFLDELPATIQGSENTQLPEEERLLDEIFSTSHESLDDLPVTALVPEDTQILEEEQQLEETLTTSPGYAADSEDITSEVNTDINTSDLSGIIDVEWVGNATSTNEAAGIDIPETLEVAVQSIEQIFDSLPPIQDISTPNSLSTVADSTSVNPSATSNSASLVPAQSSIDEAFQISQSAELINPRRNEYNPASAYLRQADASPTPNLSVRVDSERLEQINNLVGELAINRNGLSLQNEQLQGSVRELLNRFGRVQNMVGDLRKLSDQMLVAPQRHKDETLPPSIAQLGDLAFRADFDSLELDTYGILYSRLQGLLEDMMQLEEAVDDIVLFAKQSNQTLEQQRQMLTQLRDELMWARMLPLGEVLNRFPRLLRDLSTTYHKPVSLKLSGTSVLVDKAVLEKLYDPLLHLLRNAFDHGIEFPQIRRSHGKPEQGQIEIKAYHQGSQTIIEVRDDGQGLNLERIGRRALEMGLLSAEQLRTISYNHLQEFIFEPGFSTASQVSELSGRGVGLDVVRGQLRSLKGTITVTSSPGKGTTFTLRLPLTLTIAKLLVCFIGPTAVAIPSDSIEEIVIPKAEQIKRSGTQRFLHWRGEIVPTYRLAECLDYTCPLPETAPSKALIAVPSPKDWALPMLVLRKEQQLFALEIERLVTEQELVIKPFGNAIAPPSCTYGCTILGDGSLIPVLDAALLLDQLLNQGSAATTTITSSNQQHVIAIGPSNASAANDNLSAVKAVPKTRQAPTVLVVDDAVALRRTLALTLERAGCRVLQAKDGREALEQLQQTSDARRLTTSSVDLVICDIEMPNMNGFEFLSQRRQDPQLLKIPVVMLTSRSNDKHRWLAMQLGATAYFTKPYLEQEFLGAIKHIIGESTSDSRVSLKPSF